MNPLTRLAIISTVFSLLISGNSLVQGQGLQITIETKFLSASDDFLEDVGIDWQLTDPQSDPDEDESSLPNSDLGIPDGNSGSFFGKWTNLTIPNLDILTDREFEVLLRAEKRREDADLISAPKIVLNNGQPTRVNGLSPLALFGRLLDGPPDGGGSPDGGSPFGGPFGGPPVGPPVWVTSTVMPGDVISTDITVGSFFGPFEQTFDIFVGGAQGNMSHTETRTNTFQETVVTEQTVRRMAGVQPVFMGSYWVDVPIYRNERVQVEETVTRVETEEFMRGSFYDQASIYGIRCACFCGLYFGMGGLVQYMDGDMNGAWVGELQGIARYPFEFENFAVAPYIVSGVGAFLSTDNYATVSLGGGIEVRTSPNFGIFTEVKETRTNDKGMKFTGVTGGVRMRTDGTGKRIKKKNVLVKDGQTIAIGGLIGNSASERSDKVPILGNIPFLNRLFKSKNTDREKRNLMILVTPEVIKGGD